MKRTIADLIFISDSPISWKLHSKAQLLLQALRIAGFVSKTSQANLSISCVSLKTMTKLNAKFRGKRYPTDVLSFEQPTSVKIKGSVFLGDLVLCPDVARKQAKKFGHPVATEVEILLVHGAMHLLGYDHERSKNEALRMEKAEAKVLRLLGGQNQRAGLISRSKVNA